MSSVLFGGLTVESSLAIFLVVWWLVFLMALPVGVSRDENPVPGQDAGAPGRPRLLAKALVTTAISVALTWGIALALSSGAVQFGRPSVTAAEPAARP